MAFEVATVDARHGRLTFYVDDEFVGRSLAEYGEYSEEECIVFQKCLRPGQTVVEVGANIGAHTVPIAKIVGETGRVIAFEPCAEIAQLLSTNLEQNHVLSWCHVLVMAAGEHQGRAFVPELAELKHKNFGRIEVVNGGLRGSVPMETIDSFDLDKLHFLKIDAEGSELAIIRGARETIKKFRPIIYCENDREGKSAALISELIDLKYRLFWHRPPLFSPMNARLNQKNVFGDIVSLMMICVPEERGIEVVGMDEVADIRQDDDMINREIDRYKRYAEINPDDLNARGMAAHCCGMMRRNDECEALIAENLRRDPKHVPTLVLQGMRTLQAGKWKEGWPLYELRYQQKRLREFGGHRQHPGIPKWNGEETDRPLLIWNEQGFGDTIMFARFVKWARTRAPNITLEVPPELFELFEQSGFRGLTRAGRRLPHYDLHCSIPSLPATLGVDRAEMHMPGPYLFADPAMIEKWRWRNRPKIGVCHVGSPRSERPFTRDLPGEFLEGIGKRFGPFLSLVQEGQFESFADTAAAIANLDLVITVDTSVAHLAGAMGRPVWLLLSFEPDWRWGLKDTRTIWYPSMRIFRQPKFRDWEAVMRDVALALEQRQPNAA